jgi:lipoprotein-anchoring transpeptidase ErfK/SrfK
VGGRTLGRSWLAAARFEASLRATVQRFGAPMLVVAITSITAGATIVALGVAGASAPVAAAVHHHHRPAHLRTVDRLAPIVLPPVPSTTTTSAPSPTAPAVGDPEAPAGGGGVPVGGSGGVQPHVVLPGLPVGSSAPANVTDPSVVATAQVRTLPLYASPDAPAPSRTLANPNSLGARVVLLVTASQPGWVEAYVPMRPNETMAWVPTSDVALSFVTYHIVVHLKPRDLVLYHDNAPVFTAPVAPGAPDAPTPTGSFFVAYMVKVSDPGGPYGPYALGTSDFSGTYYSFEGGPGQIGIHGTDQPWVIGTYASHGCIRLFNKDITTVAQQIVPGTPVEIED